MTLICISRTSWALTLFTVYIIRANAAKTFLTPSGKLVPLSAVYQNHPSVPFENLQHLIFEYYKNGSLISHHAHIKVHEIAPSVAYNHNGELFSVSNSTQSRAEQPYPLSALRQGHGYTFVFEEHSDLLLAAWGPALQLHPINLTELPATFFNAAVVQSPKTDSTIGFQTDRAALAFSKALLEATQDSSTKQIGTPINCKERLQIAVAATHDTEFQKVYGDTRKRAESVLSGLIAHVKPLFDRSTCIILASQPHSETEITAPRPHERCSGSYYDPICAKNAKALLDFAENSLNGYHSINYSSLWFTAKILFTGHEDNSPLSGAAYRAGACIPYLSAGWVKGARPAVFAHEIGHMLGAPHDEGVMSEVVKEDQDLVLSRNSIAAIKRFISEDPRSWCLKRNPIITDEVENKEDWVQAIDPDNAPKQNWSMTTTLPFEQQAEPSVFILSYFVNLNGSTDTAVGSVIYLPKFPCLSNSESKKCWKFAFRILFPRTQLPLDMSIAVGQLRNKTSIDLAICQIAYIQGKQQAIYDVGFNFQPGKGLPSSFITNLKIDPFNSENVQCSDMTFGYVRGGSTPDLIHVHVDRRLLGNVLIYYVGYDVGPDGDVRGGWSNEIKIPHIPFYKTRSISIEVYDLDNNGMPEMVVALSDISVWGDKRWVRVGRDLNTTGHVTNGWTNYLEGFHPYDSRLYNTGAMTLYRFEGSKTAVVLLQQIGNVMDLIYRKNFFSSAFLNTAKSQPVVTELDDGCKECFRIEDLHRCLKEVYVCAVRIDPVMTVGANKALRLASSRSQLVGNANEMGTLLTREAHLAFLSTLSIYCVGFSYLLSTGKSCEMFDRRTVTAKGVEVAFRLYFGENSPLNTSISSSSLLEDPAGLQGHRRIPVAVKIEITGSKNNYETNVKQALWKLKKHAGMTQFTILERKHRYKKEGDRLFILFIYNIDF